MRSKSVAVVVLVGPLCLGACESTQDTAVAVGAIVGGIAGAVLFSDSEAGVLIGGAAGAMIGGGIGYIAGKALSPEDHKKAQAATQQVLVTPQPTKVEWTSDTNSAVHGYSEPAVATSAKPAPASSVSTRTCRSVRNVVYTDGEEASETVEYCLEGGQWQPV